jgi:transposase
MCTWAKNAPGQLTVRPHAYHEAIQAARQRQETEAFWLQCAAQAGIEGTHSQSIRRCGLRQARYIGLAKIHLQHLLTAVVLNVARLGAWWLGTPLAKTRCSPFAALRVAAASGDLAAAFALGTVLARLASVSVTSLSSG